MIHTILTAKFNTARQREHEAIIHIVDPHCMSPRKFKCLTHKNEVRSEKMGAGRQVEAGVLVNDAS